jgi:two-component system KDP operon response regulator KdpE
MTENNKKYNLLIVDDEPEIRTALSRILNFEGYSTTEASSGSEALQLLSETEYDLMLLDIRMPGMDGHEVMQEANKRFPNLLIIVLTAYGTLESARTAFRSEVINYLLKPLQKDELLEAVQHALQTRTKRIGRQQLLKTMGETLSALRQAEVLSITPLASEMDPERFLHVYPLTLDREGLSVMIANHPNRCLELTAGEAAVLASLMARPNEVLTCQDLAVAAWGCEVDDDQAKNLVRPHISRLRYKIEAVLKEPRLIRTVRKRGYLFYVAES